MVVKSKPLVPDFLLRKITLSIQLKTISLCLRALPLRTLSIYHIPGYYGGVPSSKYWRDKEGGDEIAPKLLSYNTSPYKLINKSLSTNQQVSTKCLQNKVIYRDSYCIDRNIRITIVGSLIAPKFYPGKSMGRQASKEQKFLILFSGVLSPVDGG